MKNELLCFLFSLFSLFSCQTNEKTEMEVAQMMHGTWITKSYINSIKQTLSPYKSRSLLKGIPEIDIDSKQLVRFDSLTVALNINNHEAFDFYLVPKKGETSLSLCFNEGTSAINDSLIYQLGLEIANADTLLVLYSYNKQGVFVEKTEYIRFMDFVEPIPTTNNGIQQFVNQTLFAGNYDLYDSKKQKVASVTLDQEGGISDFFPNFCYYIATDFAIDYQNNADQFYMNPGHGYEETYIFEMNSLGFDLYQIKDMNAPSLQKGERVYRFERK